MKRPGARWKNRTGEHVIHVRALALSDRWEAAMKIVFSRVRVRVRASEPPRHEVAACGAAAQDGVHTLLPPPAASPTSLPNWAQGWVSGSWRGTTWGDAHSSMMTPCRPLRIRGELLPRGLGPLVRARRAVHARRRS